LLVEEDVCDQIAAAADPELEDRLQVIFDGVRGQVLVGAGGALAVGRRVERRDVPVAGGQ
jgi:hypothetical protein